MRTWTHPRSNDGHKVFTADMNLERNASLAPKEYREHLAEVHEKWRKMSEEERGPYHEKASLSILPVPQSSSSSSSACLSGPWGLGDNQYPITGADVVEYVQGLLCQK